MKNVQRLPIACPIIGRFRELARSWGGDVWSVPKGTIKGWRNAQERLVFTSRFRFWEAPFTSRMMGVFYHRGVLVYEPSDRLDWVDMPHELGHVFASRKDPSRSKEYDFLGWEVALIKHVGADREPWVESNSDYADEFGNEMGDMSPGARDLLLAERVQHARKIGLVTRAGVPVSVRGLVVQTLLNSW